MLLSSVFDHEMSHGERRRGDARCGWLRREHEALVHPTLRRASSKASQHLFFVSTHATSRGSRAETRTDAKEMRTPFSQSNDVPPHGGEAV